LRYWVRQREGEKKTVRSIALARRRLGHRRHDDGAWRRLNPAARAFASDIVGKIPLAVRLRPEHSALMAGIGTISKTQVRRTARRDARLSLAEIGVARTGAVRIASRMPGQRADALLPSSP
jgi:hypothetical protein